MLNNSNLNDELREIRKAIFITAYKGKSSGAHLASSFSVVEMLYTLYCRNVLRIDPQDSQWVERDKLVLSKGHASLALYQFLNRVGYIPDDVMNTFCFPDSYLGGEPNMVEIPGIEATTGSLGHGLPFAVGIAMANKLSKIDSNVYVILGDGECQEGSVWEAVMAANRYNLDNLTVLLDCNRLQKMDTVGNTMDISSWRERWSAFGWEVIDVDGHSVDELDAALKKPREIGDPRVVLAHTIKGKGVSTMENRVEWHFRMPSKRELKVFMEELGISQEELQ